MILSQDEILKKVRQFESGDHTDPVAADNYFIFALCDYERFLLHAATTPTQDTSDEPAPAIENEPVESDAKAETEAEAKEPPAENEAPAS